MLHYRRIEKVHTIMVDSLQEKQQILEEVNNTKNIVVVAKKHNIPVTTIHTWLHKLRHSSTMNNDLSIENKQLKNIG